MDGDACVQTEDNESFLPLLVGRLPQQLEVRAPEDDWSGLTDPEKRRRLQNRLNQRAWRRRKANQRRQSRPAPAPTILDANENMPSFENCFRDITDINSLATDSQAADQSFKGASSLIRVSRPGARRSATTCNLGLAEIQEMMFRFEESAYRDYTLGSPRIDHLLTLIQFNVFRGLLKNTFTLGFTMEWLNEDALSPFNTTNPERLAISCPPSLRPTSLQRTILHHPWIDLFPIPAMRDNILRAGESFDDTQLCVDLVECWNSPSDRSGLIVWGDPWDLRNWEVSEEFLKKWTWVVRGCQELFQSTNYWRMKRGEKKLFSDASLSEPVLPRSA